jgi:2-polyprenyl-3-methyl-5-hydroxy-6-metoxy-1,4-benzoquinol methylase
MGSSNFPSKMKHRVRNLALRFLRRLPPERTLRLLFRLENSLYFLEGQAAIAYGGGLNPKHRLTNYHDFFIERIQADERVLDIGCGVGALANDIAQKSQASVTAIDVNPQNIAQAQSRYAHPNLRFIVADALQTLPQGPFDVVVLSNVLEHFSERDSFLLKLVADVSPARLLIRVPTFERDWRVPLKRELGVDWRLDPTHHTEYSLETFHQEMSRANLEIVHLEARWGEIWAEIRPLLVAK